MVIIFALSYFYICNYYWINAFIVNIFQKKPPKIEIDTSWMIDLIRKKTGLKLKNITVFDTKETYGMMAGFGRLFPQLILSTGMMKLLDKKELEWVLLHEAGHALMWHTILKAIIQFIFLFIGIWLISLLGQSYFYWILIPIFIIAISFLCIQTDRYLVEYQADKFSITRVSDPNAVITAQNKLIKKSQGTYLDQKSFFRRYFHCNILPDVRIKLAKQRINKTN